MGNKSSTEHNAELRASHIDLAKRLYRETNDANKIPTGRRIDTETAGFEKFVKNLEVYHNEYSKQHPRMRETNTFGSLCKAVFSLFVALPMELTAGAITLSAGGVAVVTDLALLEVRRTTKTKPGQAWHLRHNPFVQGMKDLFTGSNGLMAKSHSLFTKPFEELAQSTHNSVKKYHGNLDGYDSLILGNMVAGYVQRQPLFLGSAGSDEEKRTFINNIRQDPLGFFSVLNSELQESEAERMARVYGNPSSSAGQPAAEQPFIPLGYEDGITL